MLHPHHTKYEHLYVYHLDMPTVPQINDSDLIGTWIEDGSAILFFHREKESMVHKDYWGSCITYNYIIGFLQSKNLGGKTRAI